MIPNTGSTVVLRFLYNSLALSVSIASFISTTHFLWCFLGGFSCVNKSGRKSYFLFSLTDSVGFKLSKGTSWAASTLLYRVAMGNKISHCTMSSKFLRS